MSGDEPTWVGTPFRGSACLGGLLLAVATVFHVALYRRFTPVYNATECGNEQATLKDLSFGDDEAVNIAIGISVDCVNPNPYAIRILASTPGNVFVGARSPILVGQLKVLPGSSMREFGNGTVHVHLDARVTGPDGHKLLPRFMTEGAVPILMELQFDVGVYVSFGLSTWGASIPYKKACGLNVAGMFYRETAVSHLGPLACSEGFKSLHIPRIGEAKLTPADGDMGFTGAQVAPAEVAEGELAKNLSLLSMIALDILGVAVLLDCALFGPERIFRWAAAARQRSLACAEWVASLWRPTKVGCERCAEWMASLKDWPKPSVPCGDVAPLPCVAEDVGLEAGLLRREDARPTPRVGLDGAATFAELRPLIHAPAEAAGGSGAAASNDCAAAGLWRIDTTAELREHVGIVWRRSKSLDDRIVDELNGEPDIALNGAVIRGRLETGEDSQEWIRTEDDRYLPIAAEECRMVFPVTGKDDGFAQDGGVPEPSSPQTIPQTIFEDPAAAPAETAGQAAGAPADARPPSPAAHADGEDEEKLTARPLRCRPPEPARSMDAGVDEQMTSGAAEKQSARAADLE